MMKDQIETNDIFVSSNRWIQCIILYCINSCFLT